MDALFDEMEQGSLKSLRDAARQIITLSTTLLDAFFGLLAFKDALEYLIYIKIMIIGAGASLAFLIALFIALSAVSPKRYDFPYASLTQKRIILNDMLALKHKFVGWLHGYSDWGFVEVNSGVGYFLALPFLPGNQIKSN